MRILNKRELEKIAGGVSQVFFSHNAIDIFTFDNSEFIWRIGEVALIFNGTEFSYHVPNAIFKPIVNGNTYEFQNFTAVVSKIGECHAHLRIL